MPRIDDVQSADGTRIAVFRWEPSGQKTGNILLCHGVGEHIGRYEYVAEALAQKGWQVTGVEFRGHGHSDGKRGHVNAWSDYVADMRAVANLIDGPYAIVAHSMGALITLDYLRVHTDAIAVAVCAPPLAAAVPIPAWKIWGSRILNRILPRLSMDNEIPAEWVCRDPDVVAAYVADPLNFSTLTPRWFMQFQKAILRVEEHATKYKLPMYIFWGTGDKIVGVDKLDSFADRADAQTRAWSDMYHECLNEKQRDKVIGELTDWLEPHLSSASVAA